MGWGGGGWLVEIGWSKVYGQNSLVGQWSPRSTGLPPTVRPLMAELPDVEEFIGRAGGRERAAEMNE